MSSSVKMTCTRALAASSIVDTPDLKDYFQKDDSDGETDTGSSVSEPDLKDYFQMDDSDGSETEHVHTVLDAWNRDRARVPEESSNVNLKVGEDHSQGSLDVNTAATEAPMMNTIDVLAGPFMATCNIQHSFPIPGTAQTFLVTEMPWALLLFCNVPDAWRWRQNRHCRPVEKRRFCLMNKRCHPVKKRRFYLTNKRMPLPSPLPPLAVQDPVSVLANQSMIAMMARRRATYFAQKRKPILLQFTEEDGGCVDDASNAKNDVPIQESSWAKVATAEVVEQAQEKISPLAPAHSLFVGKVEPTTWTCIRWKPAQDPEGGLDKNSEDESSENSADSEADSSEEEHAEVGRWVQYLSKKWQHPLRLQETQSRWWPSRQLDAFLGDAETVSTDEKHSDKCNHQQQVAETDSASTLPMMKFGKMLTEVYEDFQKQHREVTIARSLGKEKKFRMFLLEQHQAAAVLRECAARYEDYGCPRNSDEGPCSCHNRQHLVLWWLNYCRTTYLVDNNQVSLLEKCKQEDSLNEFMDAKFDKENEEHNRAWSNVMKEDDEDDRLWFNRSHPIGMALQQDLKAYVPIPFRVQEGDENGPDRSHKQVKISNIPPWIESEQLVRMFQCTCAHRQPGQKCPKECCHGRFEKVFVPTQCGGPPRCSRGHNCSGNKWKGCEHPVPRGFAYITFYNHQHAEDAISKFDGHREDNVVISVTWAKHANTPGSAFVKPAAKNECAKATTSVQQVRTDKIVVSRRPTVTSAFQFEGTIKGLNGCPRGKLSMGVIALSESQQQLLRCHPLWQDGFKSDVFWHRNDCSNRETRRQGETVTFTVIVGSGGDGMQAQHVVVKQ